MYEIRIGEGVYLPLDEDAERVTPYCKQIEGKTVYYDPGVRFMEHPDAPCFPHDVTGRSNERRPASSVWHEVMEEAGLAPMFFDPVHGLMPKADGCTFFSRWHALWIGYAVWSWKDQHPGTIPGFCRDDDPIEYDATLARLLWLEWWMEWALEHCEIPAISYRG